MEGKKIHTCCKPHEIGGVWGKQVLLEDCKRHFCEVHGIKNCCSSGAPLDAPTSGDAILDLTSEAAGRAFAEGEVGKGVEAIGVGVGASILQRGLQRMLTPKSPAQKGAELKHQRQLELEQQRQLELERQRQLERERLRQEAEYKKLESDKGELQGSMKGKGVGTGELKLKGATGDLGFKRFPRRETAKKQNLKPGLVQRVGTAPPETEDEMNAWVKGCEIPPGDRSGLADWSARCVFSESSEYKLVAAVPPSERVESVARAIAQKPPELRARDWDSCLQEHSERVEACKDLENNPSYLKPLPSYVVCINRANRAFSSCVP